MHLYKFYNTEGHWFVGQKVNDPEDGEDWFSLKSTCMLMPVTDDKSGKFVMQLIPIDMVEPDSVIRWSRDVVMGEQEIFGDNQLTEAFKEQFESKKEKKKYEH